MLTKKEKLLLDVENWIQIENKNVLLKMFKD